MEEENVERSNQDGNPLNYKICNYFNRRKTWRHFKKFAPIFVKKADKDMRIETPDGMDNVVRGDYICKGQLGELWPLKQRKLDENYVISNEIRGEWTKYRPNHRLKGVLAVRVHKEFEIESKFGLLKGNKGKKKKKAKAY